MSSQADIVLKIKVDKTEAAQSLNNLSTEIAKLKEEQAKLNQSYKDGNISQSAYLSEAKKLTTQIQQLTAQQSNAAKVVTASKGSIDELTSALALNKKAYNSLSQEQRNNENIGGRLRTTIQNQQRSLGDLTSTIAKPSGLTAMFKGMATSLGAMGLAFVSIEGAVKAFKFVIAQSGDATDTFEQNVNGMSESLKSMARDLIDVDFEGFWKRASDAFKKGKDAKAQAQDLEDKTNLTKIRQNEINDKIIKKEEILSTMAKKNLETSADFIKITKEVNDLKSESAKLDETLAKEKLANKLNIGAITPEDKKDIESGLEFSKNATLDQINLIQEYKNTLDEYTKWYNAGIIGRGNAPLQKSFITEEDFTKLGDLAKQLRTKLLASVPRSEALGIIKLFQLGPEEEKNILDSYNAVQEATTAVTEVVIDGQQTISALQYRKTNEDKKNAEEAKKAKAAELKDKRTQYEKELDLLIESKNLEQKVNDEYQTKQEEDAKNYAEDYFDNLYKVNDKYTQFLNDTNIEIQDLKDAQIQNEFDKENARIETFYSNLQNKVQAEKDALLSVENMKLLSAEQVKKIEETAAAESIEIEKQKKNEHIRIESERVAAVLDIVSGMASSVVEITGALGEESKKAKIVALIAEGAAATAAVVINFIQAASKGFAQMGPIAGVAGGILMTAQAALSVGAIVAKTAQGVRNINAVDITPDKTAINNKQYGGQFALGGWVPGGSHQDGGVNVNAEGGEFIVNKRAMMNPQIASFVSQANSYGNGAGQSFSNAGLSEEIVKAIRAIPVYVLETEITNAQKKVQIRENKFVR